MLTNSKMINLKILKIFIPGICNLAVLVSRCREAQEEEDCKATPCPLFPQKCGERPRSAPTRGDSDLPTLFGVVSGQPVKKPGDFPWIGALGWGVAGEKQEYRCGGTLITSKHILTAAHCMENPLGTPVPGPDTVVLGVVNLESDGVQQKSIRVAQIKIHPQYVVGDPNLENDIAVLELEHAVDFSAGVQPACLPGRAGLAGLQLPEQSNVEVAGWGETFYLGQTSPSSLQKGLLQTVSRPECQKEIDRTPLGGSSML